MNDLFVARCNYILIFFVWFLFVRDFVRIQFCKVPLYLFLIQGQNLKILHFAEGERRKFLKIYLIYAKEEVTTRP